MLPVTVYADGPPPEVRCQTATVERINPGFCTTVSCMWAGGGGAGTVTVDDRGNASGIATECREDNNVFAINVSCP